MFINPKRFSRTPNQPLPSILVNPYIIGIILSFINTPPHISAPIHIARHTFATLALSKGVSVESVSKMLGHTNIATTQIYARIVNKKIECDMVTLAQKLGDFDAIAI